MIATLIDPDITSVIADLADVDPIQGSVRHNAR
jgi:hypothetical protein